jgi:hypothetical protein
VSSPSTHQNRLNQQKTKEKKLSPKWHSSYAPLATINIWINSIEPVQKPPLAPFFLNRISRTESVFCQQVPCNEYLAGAIRANSAISTHNSYVMNILATTSMQ